MRHLIYLFIVVCLSLPTACVRAPLDKKPKPIEEAHLSMQKGIEAHTNGLYTEALTWFSRAQRLHESLDQRNGVAISHLNLAELNMILSEDEKAFEHLKEAQAIILTDGLMTLTPNLHLLASSYEIRQGNYSGALGIVNNYIHQASLPEDLQLAFLANRIKIAIETEPLGIGGFITQYESRLNGNADSLHQMRLQRFKLQAGLVQPETNLYENILARYRLQASRVNIAETLIEWANQLAAAGQSSEAKERLARAAKIRLHMGDKIGSEKIIMRIESL